MIVRIRLGTGPTLRGRHAKNRRIALAAGSLLTPAAVMASSLGLWRLGADLNLAGRFAISAGLFSHWQVWLGAAALLEAGAIALTRYARADNAAPDNEPVRGIARPF